MDRDQRNARTALMERKREDVARLEAEHATVETQQRELESALANDREARETAQQASSQAIAASQATPPAQTKHNRKPTFHVGVRQRLSNL